MANGEKRTCSYRVLVLVRNIFYAIFMYSLTVGLFYLSPFTKSSGTEKTPSKTEAIINAGLGSGTNSRLRPASLIENINDGFLGPRPHVDTYANYTMLVERCRGSAEKLERMRKVGDCMTFLREKESEYLYIPSNPPSKQSSDYPTIEEARPASEHDIGTCPGPIVHYHTYWTGPATWRVELFVKSYLYTQNLPCSRLHIWLDADTNPLAIEDMEKDPLFLRFMPLVKRGDIVLRAWKFPMRIPLPTLPEDVATDVTSKKHLIPSANGETVIGDGVVRKDDGSEWLVLTPRQMTFLPVAVSDAVRFIVLHLYGGVYCDMDILMLKDMRPLMVTPEHSFAERWAAHLHPGDYNTAVMALSANSSLSSYLLRGGIRMGLNFHPRIIGRMAYKDGRSEEFVMFETALFDPIWTEFNWGREGTCTIPCFKDYGQVFVGEKGAVLGGGEWDAFNGKQLEQKQIAKRGQILSASTEKKIDLLNGDYNFEVDRYPPNNRTMENFFRGAFTYHIHNQVRSSSSFFSKESMLM